MQPHVGIGHQPASTRARSTLAGLRPPKTPLTYISSATPAYKRDLKALAAAVGGKRARMADVAAAERATGYVAGGISPLGQRKRLPTVVDSAAEALGTVFCSAGRRGLEVELAPKDLARLTGARFAPISGH